MVETVANIDAQIEWPEPLDELWPDITFLWLDGGLTAVQDFQEVSGLNVTLDTDIELVITGGADAHRFEVSDSGTTLKALEEFNFDDPQDGLIPGVLSVELGLRDGEGAVFDETRAYIVIRPDDTSGLPYQVLGQQLLDAIESNIADLLEIIGDWADATDGGGAAASQTVARSVLWDPETWTDLWATLPQDNPQLYALLEPVWGPIQTTLATWGDTDPSDLLNGLLDQLGVSLEDVLDWLPETDEDFLPLLLINWLDTLPKDQSDGNDLLVSTSSGSTLAASLGTDLFVSLPEDDQVVYDGVRSDFVADALAHGLVAVHKPGGESDLLVGVEQVVFDDGKLLFDIDSDCMGLVYRMYVACLGRTPDEAGLRFWSEAMDYIQDVQPWLDKADYLADRFIEALEFEALYGANPSNESYVDALYVNAPPAQAGGFRVRLKAIRSAIRRTARSANTKIIIRLRRLLGLYVLNPHIVRHIAARANPIATRPQMLTPVPLAQAAKLSQQFVRTTALQMLNCLADRKPRRDRYQQVHVVTIDVPRVDDHVVRVRGFPDQFPTTQADISAEHLVPVFRRPYDMVLTVPNRVAASFVTLHAPSLAATAADPGRLKGVGFSDPLSGTVNVLGRPAEAAGRDYWVGRMDAGVGADDMLVYFVESAEAKAVISPDYTEGAWVV